MEQHDVIALLKTKEELKRKIRNEERKINEEAAGADWVLYCAYQYKLAQALLALGLEFRKGARRIRIDRPTLRLLNKKDFPDGTVIAVGKYRITIRGQRGEKTTVLLCRGARIGPPSDDLTESQMPQYIHRFVF